MPATDKPHLFKTLKTWEESLPPNIGGATGINDFINWTKHGENDTRPEKAKISELEVITTISRAISKFAAVYDGLSPQMAAFRDWAIARIQASTEGVLLPSAF